MTLRKTYNVTVGTPRGTSKFAILLTDAEADAVRFFAEEAMKAAAADGSLDFLAVEEVA